MQPSRFHEPRDAAASRIATTSAWASGIMRELALVAAVADHRALGIHHHCADGDVAGRAGLGGERERAIHRGEIGGVGQHTMRLRPG